MGLHPHQVHRSRPSSPTVYVRHRLETTLLYQIVQDYWPEFQAELASHGKRLPTYVTREFDEYLKCGRLEHGFLRVRCDSCHDEKLVAFSWPFLRIPAQERPVTYRIAVGPNQGRKVFTLQTLADIGSDNLGTTRVGEVSGFSLHAGVATKANERAKLERLCRYVTRPPLSTKRLLPASKTQY